MTATGGFDGTADLERIGHREPVAPPAATLRALHLAHVRTVPCENPDVWPARPIRLDEGATRAAPLTRFGIEPDRRGGSGAGRRRRQVA